MLKLADDLELRGLLHQQIAWLLIAWLLALKNFIEVACARRNSSIRLTLWLNRPRRNQ